MDNVMNELLAAEGCVMDILEAYMDTCEHIIKRPDLAAKYATVSKNMWTPFLEEVRKSYATHEKAIEQRSE